MASPNGDRPNTGMLGRTCPDVTSERVMNASHDTDPGDTGKAAKPAPEPWLIDARAAAALAGVSKRTWLRLDQAERVPAPVRLGRSVRWSRPELERWIELGCPARRRMPTRKGVRHG